MTAAYGHVQPPKALAKLDRLRSDFLTLAEWAEDNQDGNHFAVQVARYARARLAEWDQPLEEWEP